MRRPEALLFALSLPFAADLAHAEPTSADRNAAHAFADKGADLFEAGKYAEATEQFRQAEALVHAAPHILYMARSAEKLGRLVEAHRLYEDILTDLITPSSPAAFRQAQETARAESAALLERIPTVKLTLQSPDAGVVKVTVDAKAVAPALLQEPLLLDPGSHTIKAEGRGLVSDSALVKVSERDKINVTLSLKWQGPLYPALIAFGAGAVGLGVGAIAGAVSLSKVGDLADRCPMNHCMPSDKPIGDSARSLGTVSTVGFVAGGLLVGAGVALFILRPGGGPPPPEDPEERLLKQPAGAWVRARVGLGALTFEGGF